MDGTLLDSMPIWNTIGLDYLASVGLQPREDTRDALRPLSMEQSAKYFCEEFSLDKTVPQICDEINALVADFYKSTAPLKPYVREYLQALKARGVKMCVATATDKPHVLAALKRNDILTYFDGILTCTEIGSDKTQPLIFEAARELLGTPKGQTWVFEDSYHAIVTAKNAGFPVVAVYDESADAFRKRIIGLADEYFASFDEARKQL